MERSKVRDQATSLSSSASSTIRERAGGAGLPLALVRCLGLDTAAVCGRFFLPLLVFLLWVGTVFERQYCSMRDNGVDGGGEERVAEAECIAELISERSSCFRSGESIFFVGLFVLLWYCLNQLPFDVIALLHLVLLHVGVWESPLELVVPYPVKQRCIVNRRLGS